LQFKFFIICYQLNMKQTLFLLVFFITITTSAQIRINELMSNNVSAVMDESYNYSMWLEIYNPNNEAIYQNDFFLTDDPTQPQKWQFPYFKIEPKGFNVIWMEKHDREYHASFKLKPEGGILYIYNYMGEAVDYVKYPAQYRNISYGLRTDGGDEWVFFEDYSFGTSNNSKPSKTLRCAKPVLTVPGGFYSGSLAVSFETPAAGDTIYFNLNSEEPTRLTSTSYIPGSPIPVNSNSVIRAKTFSSGKLSSDIVTTTYLIGQRAFNLPVVSLVTPTKNLFDNTIGIYVAGTNGIEGCGDGKPYNWNQNWDRPANFELFDRQRIPRLNQEVDIQTAGCASLSYNPQKSLHIQPKKKFGNNKLQYPIFSSRTNLQYKDITLRNSGNDFYYSMMRDGMMQTLIMGRMNIEYLAYEPAVLFLNGEYYGIQNLRQRSNADLLYTEYGLDNEEVEMIENYEIQFDPRYLEMLNFIQNNDIRSSTIYEQLKNMMDVESYMQVLMTNIYVANYDWPHNNVRMWRKIDNGKWRWILFDTDFGFNLFIEDLHNFNSLTYALGENNEKETKPWATQLFKRLMENDSFRNEFIDRFTVHLSSTFKTDRVNHIIDSLAAKISTEIVYHKQRWGNSGREFEDDLIDMKNFSAARGNNMMNFIGNRFLSGASQHTISISANIPNATYTFNNAPILDPAIELKNYAGRNFNLKANNVKGYLFKSWEVTGMANIQTIIPWDSHWKYWDGATIPATNWHSLNYQDDAWKSGQAQLGYGNKGETTKVDFGPDVYNKYQTCYLRKNFTVQDVTSIGNATVRLFVDDGAVVYVNGTEIGRFNLPAGNISFTTYASSPNDGAYTNFTIPVSLLQNGNNVIAVEVHQVSASSSDMRFNLDVVFYFETASAGYTSPVISGVVTPGISLKAIYELDTTPDPIDNVKVYINELVASNSKILDEYGEKDDFIELYNAGNEPVNISGWYVSDKQAAPALWKIPVSDVAVIPAKGFLILWADEQTFQGPLHVDIKLSASGEYVSLYAENKFGELVLMDEVEFPALPSNMAYARMPDGGSEWRIQEPTIMRSNLTTSIDNDLNSMYAVYPTRFTEQVVVENAAGEMVQLFDLTGKRLLQTISNDNHFVLQLGHLHQGMYVLKVGNQNYRILK